MNEFGVRVTQNAGSDWLKSGDWGDVRDLECWESWGLGVATVWAHKLTTREAHMVTSLHRTVTGQGTLSPVKVMRCRSEPSSPRLMFASWHYRCQHPRETILNNLLVLTIWWNVTGPLRERRLTTSIPGAVTIKITTFQQLSQLQARIIFLHI